MQSLAVIATAAAVTALAMPASAQDAEAKKGSGTVWTLQAEDAPETKPWTDPATLSFKSVEDGRDSWDVALAVRAEWPVRQHRMFVSGAAIRRTATGEEQEFYAAKVGAKLDYNNVGRETHAAEEVSVYVDPSIGYARTTTFKDPDADCALTPQPVGCFKQHEESLRADVQIQPFMAWMSNAPYLDENTDWKTDHGFFHEIGFVFTPFYDHVIDAKLDATGVKQKGKAAGLQSLAAIAVTPSWLDYRLVYRASAKHMVAAERSGARRGAFPANAFLFETSLVYEFGMRSFEGGKGWTPSFGISHASGDDPLTGRTKGKDTTIAFKLSVKN